MLRYAVEVIARFFRIFEHVLELRKTRKDRDVYARAKGFDKLGRAIAARRHVRYDPNFADRMSGDKYKRKD